MKSKPTIYVVNDDPPTTNTVRGVAKGMNLECDTYTSGLKFLEAVDEGRHGCLVLSVRIADISGPQLQRRLAAQGILIPLIFVTSHPTLPVAVRVMREGAFSILEKPVVEEDLWDLIQRAICFDRQQREDRRREERLKARLANLGPREHIVWELLVEGKSNKDIANDLGIAIRTVEIRRRKLMEKLEAQSLSELVQIAMAVGDGFHVPPSLRYEDGSMIKLANPGNGRAGRRSNLTCFRETEPEGVDCWPAMD